MTARFKWEAWSGLRGMSSTDAAAEYVSTLSAGWPEWREHVPGGAIRATSAAQTPASPHLPAVSAASHPSTPVRPPRSGLPSTAPAAAAAAQSSANRAVLSERISRLRSEMHANLSVVESLEASVSQLEQRHTPQRAGRTPAKSAQTPSEGKQVPDDNAESSAASLLSSASDQAARVAAVATSAQATGAATEAHGHLQKLLALLKATWSRLLATLQPMLATAATIMHSDQLQQLLPALLRPVHAALQLFGRLLQAAFSKAGLPVAAQWAKYSAEQLQGGLKALEHKVPPGLSAVVIVFFVLGVASWGLKDLLAKVLVWVIA